MRPWTPTYTTLSSILHEHALPSQPLSSKHARSFARFLGMDTDNVGGVLPEGGNKVNKAVTGVAEELDHIVIEGDSMPPDPLTTCVLSMLSDIAISFHASPSPSQNILHETLMSIPSRGPTGQGTHYPNNSYATSATGYTVLYITYEQEALDLRREVDLYREGQEEPFVFR